MSGPGGTLPADDATRPRLHFTARSGWINDPLGLTHHDGRYHLFFQHVPATTSWATEQHWGHATSADLLHWQEGPVALSPGDGDDGVWSGSLVRDGDRAVIFYTSADARNPQLGRVRPAWPTDASWHTWDKGPFVAPLPDDVAVSAVRDPYVTHDGDSWLMLLGAGLADGSGGALAYRSHDLVRWEYDGMLASRPASATDPWTGEIWECPQLVRVDGVWALVIAAWGGGHPGFGAYALGDLRGGRFVPERWHRFTYGPSLYAGSAFHDADGAPGLVHWLREVRGADWAGAHSVPHALALRGDRLEVTPHPALAGARTGEGEAARAAGTAVVGPHEVTWTAATGGALTLARDDGPVLRLEATDRALHLHAGGEPFEMPRGDEVRVLVDGPVVEVFTAGVAGATPVRASAGPTRVIVDRGEAHVLPLA
jgi:beta-fructofuranosidase